MRYLIQKLGKHVKSNVLKFPNDQTISLRIISEKRGNVASGIQSRVLIIHDITLQPVLYAS